MKSKLLSFILAICLIIPCTFIFAACGEGDPNVPETPTPSTETVYTVSESEWEINFNITKVKSQTQTFSKTFSDSLAEITSYTLSATGTYKEYESEGTGSGILKVAPNGLDMQFFLDGQLQNEQTKTVPSTDSQYIGLKAMLTSYFSFSGKYRDFTFDTTKNAYVAQNLTVSVVSEDDISKTYDIDNKTVEVTFINGYLNTIKIELCEDNTFENVIQTFTFTFSDINNTTVILAD